jgi:hypothetical protein
MALWASKLDYHFSPALTDCLSELDYHLDYHSACHSEKKPTVDI